MQPTLESSTAPVINKAREASRAAINFSIDEILKPSFGAKNSKKISTCNAQPLDMRIVRNKLDKAALNNENVDTELNCDASPDHSADEFDSSRNSTPGRDSSSSSSRDSNFSEYEDLYRKYKLQFENKHDVPHWRESIFLENDLHFLASSTYYNGLNNFYSYDIRGNHFYNQFQPMRNVLNPHSTYQTVPSIQKCSSFYTDFGRDNIIFSKHNNGTGILTTTTPTSAPDSYPRLNINLTNNRQSGLPIKNSNSKVCTSSEKNPEKPTQTKYRRCENNNTDNNDNNTCTPEASKDQNQKDPFVWPAWVYCTRYSDRPSSGPRYRKPRARSNSENDKRPRTAFSTQQLQRLTREFETSPYLSENRRQTLALELGLTESQVKIWFQNKRAKLKKSSGSKNLLAQRLLEEGLYNHSTIVVEADGDTANDDDDDDDVSDKHADNLIRYDK